MKLFGYRLMLVKDKPHKRTNAKHYAVWSRKGKCPACNVNTGSRHSRGCKMPDLLKKGYKPVK